MTRTVVAGYLTAGLVRTEFMTSMLGVQRHGVTPLDEVMAVRSGPNLARGRNLIVKRFLTEQSADWLWMLDTDMVFDSRTLDRLITAAHPDTRPILGALCYQETDDGETRPTMYELVDKPNPAFAWYQQWPEGQVVPVAATGAACLLMHRAALVNIATRCRTRNSAWPWFKESTLGNQPIGEDLTFCLRAGVARIPVHVHTGVQVGHIKSTMLGKVG